MGTSVGVLDRRMPSSERVRCLWCLAAARGSDESDASGWREREILTYPESPPVDAGTPDPDRVRVPLTRGSDRPGDTQPGRLPSNPSRPEMTHGSVRRAGFVLDESVYGRGGIAGRCRLALDGSGFNISPIARRSHEALEGPSRQLHPCRSDRVLRVRNCVACK